jgi:DNA polymerase-3 subunit delta'
MAFGDVVGQEQVVRFLQNGLRTGRVAHAYAFVGPSGTGRKQMAMELAKALHCERLSDDACGECRNCRRIDHGNHPDVMVIAPDGQSIKIEQVRQLQRAFQYSAEKGATRVAILEQADKLTVQAANSLLKFLEEPSLRMVVVLIVENVHALLPTIRSRCQLLRFAPLPPHVIAQSLEREGIPPTLARIAGHMSQGLGQARKLACGDGFALLCERVIKWSEELLSNRSAALVTLQTEWMDQEASKETLETILDLMLLWLRDLLRVKLGSAGEPVFTDWSAVRERQIAQWTTSHLIHAMESILHARRQLAGPMQPQAVLDQMVLVMQEGSVHVGSRRSPLQTSG